MFAAYAILILVLLALGALTVVAVVAVMAIALLRPPRMTDGKAVWVLKRLSPSDLGLEFHEHHFNIRDEQTGRPMRLAGWWMPHPEAEGRCVVLLHGYADAKVGAIAWAPLWHAMKFNILAIDLRAHGESDGKNMTAGFWERHDVGQVLDQLRREKPGETREMILFGVSLGAATAAATAAMRSDLSAVVLESPPADFRAAPMSHMEHLGAPSRFFQGLALTLAERLADCDFGAVRPADMVKKIPCPVLIIAPDGDPMASESDRRQMREAIQSRHREDDVYWPVTAGHVLALHAEPQAYEQKLVRFVAAAVQYRITCPGSSLAV